MERACVCVKPYIGGGCGAAHVPRVLVQKIFRTGGVHIQEMIGGHASGIPGSRDRAGLEPPSKSVADVAVELPIDAGIVFAPVLRIVVQVEADGPPGSTLRGEEGEREIKISRTNIDVL